MASPLRALSQAMMPAKNRAGASAARIMWWLEILRGFSHTIRIRLSIWSWFACEPVEALIPVLLVETVIGGDVDLAPSHKPGPHAWEAGRIGQLKKRGRHTPVRSMSSAPVISVSCCARLPASVFRMEAGTAAMNCVTIT